MHPACLTIDDLLKECETLRTRRSGPGGQHRNKVETAFIIAHCPSGVRAEASERRNQIENRKVGIFRLRINLALNVRSVMTDVDGPSALWVSRCRGEKIVVSTEHEDFPAILAEALDFLAAEQWDVKAASARLGCTASQIIKLLQQEPKALLFVNEQRDALGLHKLR